MILNSLKNTIIEMFAHGLLDNSSLSVTPKFTKNTINPKKLWMITWITISQFLPDIFTGLLRVKKSKAAKRHQFKTEVALSSIILSEMVLLLTL